jgi:hypothetical protein
MNISLLCKWWWRLENEKGLWQGIIKAKYLQDEGVSTAKHKFGDSPIWTDIHSPEGQTDNHPKWETDIVLEGRLAGRQTHSHCCTLAPVIFDLCAQKDINVHRFLVRNCQYASIYIQIKYIHTNTRTVMTLSLGNGVEKVNSQPNWCMTI